MAGEFNVQILATLRDRVSSGLLGISRVVGSTEQKVRSLRLALADLQARQALGIRRATLAAQADKDAISLLGQKQAKLLAVGDLEANLAQRRTLNAQIRAREERAAIRNTAQQITLTRSLNREAALTAQIQSEQALGAARSGMIRGGIMLAAGGLGVGFGVHAAKAAGGLQMNETLLKVLYGYSPGQTGAIRARAFQLQQRLGNLSAGDVEQLFLTLRGSGLSRRTAGAIMPEVASAADILLRARGAPITQTATTMAQLANLFNARTAAQFRPIGEAVYKAGLIAPGSLGILETQSSYLAPLLRRGFSPTDLIRLSVVAQRLGGQGAVSPENLATLLARVQVAGSPLAPMVLGGRGYLGALRLGLPQFVRSHPHYDLQQFLALLSSDRQRLGRQGFLTDAMLAFGQQGLRTVTQLSQPQTAAMLEQVRRQMATMPSSAAANAATLQTLNGQLGLLHSNFGSLIQVLGQPLVGPLQAFNHLLAQTAGDLANIMNRHKATTATLGQVGFTASLFGVAGGALKSASAALKFAATRGWIANAGKFAGGLDVISGALGRLFPLVMAMQVGTKAGGVVGTATMREQLRHGPPLTYGTLGGPVPVMDLSSLFGHRAAAPAVTVASPVHVTVNLDGRKVAEVVTEHTARVLRHSAMSNTKARGPVASPHVYPGAK